MADYRKSLRDMSSEELAKVAPGFVPSDDISTPLSVKVADKAISLATPIDSIIEIQQELEKEEPDYLKIGMLGGMEAIGLVPSLGTAAKSMIRKGADMVRQTDEAIDVVSNVPKASKTKPEEFSGTLATRHGFTGDRPTEFLPRGEYKGERYDGTGGVFGDKPLYLEDPENPFFLTDNGVVSFSYDDVTDVDASFDKAFVLTPETVGTLKSKIGSVDLLDEASGPLVVDKLEELGYDGLIIRGFPNQETTELGRLRAEQNDKLKSLSKEDFNKGYGIVEDYKPKIQAAREAEGIDETLQQSQVLAFRPERQKVLDPADPDYVKSLTQAADVDTLEALNLTQADVDAWMVDNYAKDKYRVPPIADVADAAKQLREDPSFTSEQFREISNRLQPINLITEMPKFPTKEDVAYSIAAQGNKKKTAKGVVGVNKTIKDGTPISSRLDIPAYNNSDTWVVSLHDGTKKSGDTVGYSQTAVLDDVEFTTNPLAASSIAAGNAKSTIARMQGAWKNADPETVYKNAEKLLESIVSGENTDWVQVGMNPYRASYFYDKADGMPVVSAQQVIQVGPLVLAKKVKKTTPDDPMFEFTNKVTGVTKTFNEGGIAMDEQMKQAFEGGGFVDALFDPPESQSSRWAQFVRWMKEDKKEDESDESAFNRFIESFMGDPAERGMRKKAKGHYNEGGMAEEIDPVSGNEVPTGSLPEEVRDDIPAQLSEGEYVVPADVVRYYGVKFFEDLRNEAKMGWSDMERNGRIGGEPIMDDSPEGMEMADGELPFDITELQVVEMNEGGYLSGYAEGGLEAPVGWTGYGSTGGSNLEVVEYVAPDGVTKLYIQFLNGQPLTQIPEGYKPAETAEEQVATQVAEQSTPSAKDDEGTKVETPEPIDWSKATVEDFENYASGQDGLMQKALTGATTLAMGLPGAAILKAARKSENKAVVQELQNRIESTEDPTTKAQLQKVLDQVTPKEGDSEPGVVGKIVEKSGIFGGESGLTKNLEDVDKSGSAGFGDTWLGDLLGFDKDGFGVQGAGLSDSMGGARRDGDTTNNGDSGSGKDRAPVVGNNDSGSNSFLQSVANFVTPNDGRSYVDGKIQDDEKDK